MLTKTDFWVGVAAGLVAGMFGHKFLTENKDKLNTLLLPQQATQETSSDLALEELMQQKERLEDLIAEKQSSPEVS